MNVYKFVHTFIYVYIYTYIYIYIYIYIYLILGNLPSTKLPPRERVPAASLIADATSF